MAETTSVMLTSVIESKTNHRALGDIDELATSMRSYGCLQPILVRPVDGNRFECVFGHRRLRAARKIGLEAIPAQVRDLTDDDVLEMQLVENLMRKDIHPLEEADSYRSIIDNELMSVEDISAKVGKSRAHIYQRLRLCELGKKARDAFLAGRMTAGVAMLLSRIPDTLQDEAVGDVLDDETAGRDSITVRDAHWKLQRYNHDLRAAPFKTSDASLLAETGPCGTCPKRSGNQVDLFGEVVGEHADICTDTLCWKSKTEASWEQAKSRAEAKGSPVLDRKGVIDRWGNIEPGSGYVAASATHPDCYLTGRHAKNKTWKQLVGKNAPVAIVQHPETGATVELYERKAAVKALPDSFKQEAKSAKESRRVQQPSESVRPFDVEEMLERKWVQEAAKKTAKFTDLDTLRLIASILVEAPSGVDAAESLAWFKREDGYRLLTNEEVGRLRTLLGTAGPDQIRSLALCASLFVANVGRAHASEQLGIDEDAMRKTIVDELTATKPTKAKNAKAGK